MFQIFTFRQRAKLHHGKYDFFQKCLKKVSSYLWNSALKRFQYIFEIMLFNLKNYQKSSEVKTLTEFIEHLLNLLRQGNFNEHWRKRKKFIQIIMNI